MSSDIALTMPLLYLLCILLAPFKGLSNKLCALNLNFDNSKTKHSIATYMHRFWNAAGTIVLYKYNIAPAFFYMHLLYNQF